MRKLTPLVVLGVFGLILPCAKGVEFTLFRNVWGNVIVATDMTEEGKSLTRPTQEKPVYFLGRSLGCKLGSIPGDKLPDERMLTRFTTRILAKQGYLGAKTGVNDPTLFLVVQWGYLEPRSGELMWFLGYDPAKDIASPTFPGKLGPEVFLRNFRSRLVETILDGASGAIYGIIVTAFDFKSANTPNPIIYWQTRIGLPANGKSMAEALPTMLMAAGPAIGQPNDSPVLRDADSVRSGSIRLGDLEILGVEKDAVPRAAAPDKKE